MFRIASEKGVDFNALRGGTGAAGRTKKETIKALLGAKEELRVEPRDGFADDRAHTGTRFPPLVGVIFAGCERDTSDIDRVAEGALVEQTGAAGMRATTDEYEAVERWLDKVA